MSLLQLTKTELFRTETDRQHPFGTFALATYSTFPEIRTVVLRKVYEDLSILFFTDTRSPKVQQIQAHEQVSALFYHPHLRLQLRIKGKGVLLNPEGAEYLQFLDRIKSSRSVKDYTTAHAPGSVLEEPGASLFKEAIHFTAVKIEPLELDILQLGDVGHTRMLYRQKNAQWEAFPLIP